MNINRLRPTGVKPDDLDLWLSGVVCDAIRDAREAGLPQRSAHDLLVTIARGEDLLARLSTAEDCSIERSLPRDQRQAMIASWAESAFGREEATGIPQRGLRLLEEAIEAFQACGGDEAIAQKLVAFVFGRPPGTIGQELGGVAVTVLALAAAAKLSADQEEAREIHRVLSKPIGEFTQRNANKNAAGFKIASAGDQLPRNPCCGNVGWCGDGQRRYCSTCGQEVS